MQELLTPDPPHPSVVSQSQIKVPLSEAEARVQDANPDKHDHKHGGGGLIPKAIRRLSQSKVRTKYSNTKPNLII